MLRIFGAVLVAALLSACASGPYSGKDGKTVIVTKEVWDWYKGYVTKISGVNKGVFVVGIYNGVASSASYQYCPGTSCLAANYSGNALTRCRGYSPDLECIVFANGTDILVNYKIEGE